MCGPVNVSVLARHNGPVHGDGDPLHEPAATEPSTQHIPRRRFRGKTSFRVDGHAGATTETTNNNAKTAETTPSPTDTETTEDNTKTTETAPSDMNVDGKDRGDVSESTCFYPVHLDESKKYILVNFKLIPYILTNLENPC